MPRIYFDHNATTPLRPQVLEAMVPYLTGAVGNASSIHGFGREARDAVEAARDILARSLGCSSGEVYFTSGGTEADNWAIEGMACSRRQRRRRIVTSAVEHHAVLHTCRHLEQRGFEVIYVPVDEYGVVDLNAVESALDDNTALVSIMHANNETGTIQPLAEIGRLARARGVPLHVDAVQSFGKLDFRVDDLSADLVSVSAHKINGPKGTGALYVRSGLEIEPWCRGGGQERGLRTGTENVAGIVGLGRAVELRVAEGRDLEVEAKVLRDRLQQGLLQRVEDLHVNGHPQRRLANTLNLSFQRVEAEAVLLDLDLKGVAASSGSACAEGEPEPSHVLLAMGLAPRTASGSVRFSLGWGNTVDEVDYVVEIVPGMVQRLREMSVFS